MSMKGFSARAYFASHDPRQFRRVPKKRRELTPAQSAIFKKALAMIEDDHTVDEAVAWVRKEVRHERP